eukprot:1160950-Pelagomonas_calceolata.AAC.7
MKRPGYHEEGLRTGSLGECTRYHMNVQLETTQAMNWFESAAYYLKPAVDKSAAHEAHEVAL